MRLAFIAACALAVVVSCGADDSSGADGGEARTVQISAVEYAFNASESITIEAGDTIEFVVSNDGTIDHEMEVLTEANRRLGETDRISPGGSDSVTVTFEEPGVYRVICDIDDHRSRGQQAEFTVADPG
jgi:plastocyanin